MLELNRGSAPADGRRNLPMLRRLDTARSMLDDAAIGLTTMQRLRLTRELASIRTDLGSSPSTLARLKSAKRLAEVRTQLGAASKAAVVAPPVDPDKAADDIAEGRAERAATHQFYDFDPNRKQGQRKRDNAEAMAILRAIDDGTIDPGTLGDARRQALAKYSGTGGALIGADGKKGSAYEYYTPKPIAEGMWQLLRELGFQGGRTLDPSAGTGVFGATAPANAAVDAVELNETSGRVNALVNDGPGYKTVVAPFEQVAAATPDESYDAVITNVPFGDVADRGGNQLKDTKYRDEPIQNYFILRSLEKLRGGGLAAFITPPRCVSGYGKSERTMRERASLMAEFMGAYRLPNGVFGTAATDTMTDVMVFRKFDRATIDKIDELREQSPAVLADANVLWAEFIEGRYFKGDGRRFMLGEEAVATNRFGKEVAALKSDMSIADIAKLLRRFGDSRISWDALDAAETAPIVYRDGDTMRHAGQTLQLQAGRWVVLKSAAADDAAAELAEAVSKLTTALGAVNAGIDYATAAQVQSAMVDGGQALEVPDWLRVTLSALLPLDAGARPSTWAAVIAGLAIDQAMAEHQSEVVGFNYLEGYPLLSDAMQRVAADAARPPPGLATTAKGAMRKVGAFYSKRDGFTAVWKGDVTISVDRRDAGQRFEAARYQAGGGTFVPVDQARAVYGEAFDPMAGDDWCLSSDGLGVAKADDYYIGNYAEFLTRIDADIAAADDDAVRDKLLRQKFGATKRLRRQDPMAMTFTLFSPFVTQQERLEFIHRFVDPRFSIVFDEVTGKPFIECDINTPANEGERNLKRFAEYLKRGTVTTRSDKETKQTNPELEKRRIAALREVVQRAEAQFNTYAKANGTIISRLDKLANDPQRLYFEQVEDDSPLTIPGLNPDWGVHPYQAAYVRKTGRDFSGINGFGVGLGKTSTALIAVQHALNTGVKRKAMFVVPNSVLSNWRKEAIIPKGVKGDPDYKPCVYANGDDCLFVGLTVDKNGEAKTDPKNYDRDLNRIMENRHAKIFVTMEAFQRLRLKASTAADYDKYLAQVDSSYAASDDKKADEKSKGKRALLIEQLTSDKSKSVAAPFFEDLGVDALIIDEAHMMKNSRETVDFGGGKFLSLAEASARGLDAQAKAWFVRKDAPRKDGVILLSATPVTNSPLEVYSMLSLAIGDAKLNDLMMGVRGADDFMNVMCRMESQDEETLDGLVKPYEVFVGLSNANILRGALRATCTIKEAADVGAQIVMPDADERPTPVALPANVKATLLEYKDAFRFAIDTLMDKDPVRGSQAAFESVSEKFGEPMELIAHPFNLINKMTSLIADPELDQRATFYTVGHAQVERALDVIGRWNAKAPTEERARRGPHTAAGAVVGVKKVKDGDETVELLRIEARAKLDDERIVIDTIQPESQSAFEDLAEAQGLDLDVSVPPKLAALIENFQFEEASPRGKVSGVASGRVRQLIFCDVLAMHNKIKRLLTKRCGVAAASIAIITGKINGKPDQILKVQDGFNAEGDDNKYRVIIANEKAEVGINLQKGTQAIHHLTLGWTPDSLTQRNGRGVRQGNETGRVSVYQYDADGTFDNYKRMLVGKKASWIDSLMANDGGDSVDVSAGLTRKQLEELIDSVGDSGAMGRAQEKADAEERIARAASTQAKQAITLQTIAAQTKFLNEFAKPQAWAADKVAAYITVMLQADVVRGRTRDPKATASAVLKNQNLLAELEARRDGMAAQIKEAVTFKQRGEYNGPLVESTLLAFTSYVRGSSFYGEDKRLTPAERASKFMRGDAGNYWAFEVKDESAIGNEWQSEIDMAQAMIDESRRDFLRMGGQTGGHGAEVLNKIDSDDATVIDGKVICLGGLVERGDKLGVIVKGRSGFLVRFIDVEHSDQVAAADGIRKATVHLPGSPGYDAAVTRAAQIEDDMLQAGAISDTGRAQLVSAFIPEVAQRRTSRMMVSYSAGSHFLPAPFFPIVVRSPAPDGARVIQLIAAQQAAVVTRTGGLAGYTPTFECDSDVAVEKRSTEPDAWAALIEFAVSRKVKITFADFEAYSTARSTKPAMAMLTDSAREKFDDAVITGAVSAEQLEQRLKAWLDDVAFPHYDLASDPRLAAMAPAALLNDAWATGSYSFGRAMEAIRRAEAAAAAASTAGKDAIVAPLVAPSPAPAGSYTPDSEEEYIGINGDTRPWKEQIKAMASTRGGFKWVGEKNSPTPHWRVKYKTYLAMVAAYPASASGLKTIRL